MTSSEKLSSSVTHILLYCRDFVALRHWEQLDGWYVTSSVGVEHPSMPPQAKYVRGLQGPGIMRLKDISENRHRMEWLLNTNLKVLLYSLSLLIGYSSI